MSVFVITGKKMDYPLPEGYKPLLVGADFNKVPKGYLADNTGDNISSKNREYCELTGLYWLWQHCKDKYIGLSHYRRYFGNFNSRLTMDLHLLLRGTLKPASLPSLIGNMESADWIVSQPLTLNTSSNWEFYKNNHHLKDLTKTREIIASKYPQFTPAFDEVLKNSNQLSPYNMFFTKRNLLDPYCEWLFDILSELEAQSDLSKYSPYQRRLYGFIAERLLNVWLKSQDSLQIKYLPVFRTDEANRRHLLDRVHQKVVKRSML